MKSSKLKPIKASKKYYVNSTDEYPILFVIAALTKGVSTFKGIEDLANKESNRIVEMKKILDQIKVKSKISKNEFKIYGQEIINEGKMVVTVPNLGDHRICMSAFILALLTGAKTKIKTSKQSLLPLHLLLIMKSLEQNLKLKSKSIQISCDGGAATGVYRCKNDFKKI